MIFDGQKIILSIDYSSQEINRGYTFAIERNSWFDYILVSYFRIPIASILFFFDFFLPRRSLFSFSFYINCISGSCYCFCSINCFLPIVEISGIPLIRN